MIDADEDDLEKNQLDQKPDINQPADDDVDKDFEMSENDKDKDVDVDQDFAAADNQDDQFNNRVEDNLDMGQNDQE